MSVRLRIDRIVLDGYAFGPRERSRFEASLTTELTRLFAQPGVEAGGSIAVPAVVAPSIALRGEPGQIGAALGRSIHAGLTR